MKTQTAQLKYLKISTRKVRLVADLIRGLSANEAAARLSILPQRASGPFLKLLRSAMADAEKNQKINPDQLLIKEIRVDQGPRTKRWRTRARGSSSLIEKKSSHITIVLEESEKELKPEFKFLPKPKKIKKEKKAKFAKEENIKSQREEMKPKQNDYSKQPKKFDFLKRIFRRKTI